MFAIRNDETLIAEWKKGLTNKPEVHGVKTVELKANV
jgi:hypothetical protein